MALNKTKLPDVSSLAALILTQLGDAEHIHTAQMT